METHQHIELEQIEQDMRRLVSDAEQAAETVRATLDGALDVRNQIIERAEHEAEQIRIAARGDGDGIRADAEQDGNRIRSEAQQDGAKIRSAANQDAEAVVQETRDRAAQMLQTAQAQADTVLEEARALQLKVRDSIPPIQEMLDHMGPALAAFARASENAHLEVADAIDALQPAKTASDVDGTAPDQDG